jgi:DNA processing protein
MEEKDYWVGFSVFPGVGPVTFQKILSKYNTAQQAWDSDQETLGTILGEKKTKDFFAFKETFDFSIYKKRILQTNVSIITLVDDTYPKLLKQIKNPPFVLYVKGDISFLNTTETITVAVVGTRKVTQYGKDVTMLFTRSLAQANCIIISGLAMGVDAIAHKTTIEMGGRTVGVLGCGVDCCNPTENLALYDEIIEKGGGIISEVPLGHPPTVGTFPARNRIVAGLSQGILVTEGAEDSGALITANFSFENNRYVFAVPGPITSSLSKGPYKLIEKGAKLVTTPDAVLEELGITNQKIRSDTKRIIGDSKDEQRIIDLLEQEPLSFDELVRSTNGDSAKLGSLLSLMELKGFITSTQNGLFSLAV